MRIVPRISRRTALLLAGLLLLAAAPETPGPRGSAPVLGLDVNLAAGTPAAEQQRAFDLARRTGASLYAMTLSWAAAERSPGKYELKDITRAARSLRQSGAQLHLDLPLVAGRQRDVPADLAGVAFDDPRLSLRLGKLLDALEPALRDFSTLSLGYEADAYFADKPEELRAYRRLFDGAVSYLSKKSPRLKVGVTTASPTESPAPAVAAALHQKSPVLFYIYSPFQSGRPYLQRDPDSLERDWKDLLAASGDRPIAFPEVSYSSAPENSSTPEKQAEFVRRMRRLLTAADGRRLLFARYVSWRDVPGEPLPSVATELERRRAAFFSHRGLQAADGAAKAAWRAWVKAGT
ncbi:MAG TPA: hypothetical protein VMR54_11730 [Thermoanaerobaculia bacterium]|nr:hypothetical protein [Thermoanaerobaculia bacterium]